MTEERGNIQQRVFDRMPAYPVPIPIFQLYDLLPSLDRSSVREAMRALCRQGLVEPISGSRHQYRRAAGAQRPVDRRGGARPGAGRRRVSDHGG